MAKVLRRGDVLERKCSNCGSLCEFEYSDFQVDDTGHGHDHLECPACRHHIVVKPDEWPASWKALYGKEEVGH